jgi:hypothetical protein
MAATMAAGAVGAVRPVAAGPEELTYGTYIGGSDVDHVYAVAVDPAGALVVAGLTWSADFPVTSGAFDTTNDGGGDAFVARISPDGHRLEWATFFGGGGHEYVKAVEIAPGGRIVFAGDTSSPDLPTTDNALDRTVEGSTDAYLAVLTADGSTLEYASYRGGTGADFTEDVHVAPDGEVTHLL